MWVQYYVDPKCNPSILYDIIVMTVYITAVLIYPHKGLSCAATTRLKRLLPTTGGQGRSFSTATRHGVLMILHMSSLSSVAMDQFELHGRGSV